MAIRKIILSFILSLSFAFANGQGYQWLPIKIGASSASFTNFTGTTRASSTATVNTLPADFSACNGIVVSGGSLSATGTLTDNQGNTYTPIFAPSANNLTYNYSWFCANPTVSSSMVFTFTGTSAGGSGINGQSSISVFGFRKVGGTPSIDVSSRNNNVSGVSSLAASSLTPAGSGELYCLLTQTGNSTPPGTYTVSYPAEFTTVYGSDNVSGTNKGSYISGVVRSSSSAYAPTVTAPSNSIYVVIAVFIK